MSRMLGGVPLLHRIIIRSFFVILYAAFDLEGLSFLGKEENRSARSLQQVGPGLGEIVVGDDQMAWVMQLDTGCIDDVWNSGCIDSCEGDGAFTVIPCLLNRIREVFHSKSG